MPLGAVLGLVLGGLSASPWAVDVPAGAAPVPVGSPSTTLRAPAPSTTVTTAPGSDLGALIVDPGLPGFTAAAPGPTNGPLTAETFAAQSSDPAQATTAFGALAARPGFGAAIRLWSDTGGPGQGENDIVVLLFRIGDPAAARLFAAGLVAPYRTPGTAVPFDVPSIPGATGYTVTVTQPVAALEQAVVFAAGPYVAAVQAASSAAPSNTARLSPTQVIDVAFLESTSVQHATPPTPAPLPLTHHKTRRATPPAVRTARGTTLMLVGVLTALVLLAAAAGWVISRRRRGSRRTIVPPDPWGAYGVLDVFGGLAGDPTGVRAHGAGAVVTPRSMPRSVPELLLTPVDRDADATLSELDLPPPPSSLRPNRHPVR